MIIAISLTTPIIVTATITTAAAVVIVGCGAIRIIDKSFQSVR